MSTQFTNRQWRLPNAWNGSESNVNKQSNYSMYFNNASNVNLGTPSSGIGVFNKQVFSFSVWVKRERQNVNETIVNLFASSSNKGVELKFQYYAADGNYLCLQIGDGYNYSWYNNRVTNINSIMSLNVWYNITCTWDGTDSNIYINNVLRKNWTRNLTISYITSNQPAIGVAPNNSSKYLGQIDSFSYFDYALSSSQITTLYGSSSTGIGNPMSLSPKPVAYYPLGDQDAFNGADYLVPNSSLKDYVFDFTSGNSITTAFTPPTSNSTRSISIWFNPDNSTLKNMCGYGSAVANQGFDIVNYTSNTVGVHLYSTAVLASGTYNANEWNHYVVTYDGTTLKGYLNGNPVGTSTNTVNTGSTTFKIAAGAYSGADSYDGQLSNIQVWSSELSVTDVETLYNNGSPYLGTQPQNSNLQGWWKLNASATYDSSTTTWSIPDDSSNSNTGTSSGMTQANLVQSDLSFKTSISPFALDFDGTNDYIDCGTGLGDSIGDNYAGSLTASLWFKRSSNTLGGLITFTTSGYGEFTALVYQSYVRFIINNGGYYIDHNSSTGYTYDTNWHHLAIVMTPNGSVTDIKMYFDGQLLTITPGGSSPTPDNLDFAGKKLLIGTFDLGTYSFNGSISNVSIWNTALTSTQVTEIYSEGVPQNLLNHSAVSSLVSWWQLGSNSSFNTNWTVLDEKGSNNGTSSNMGEDAIVDGVGSYANGLSSGMGGDEVIGDAPYSSSNSLSVNMDVLDRVTDTPS